MTTRSNVLVDVNPGLDLAVVPVEVVDPATGELSPAILAELQALERGIVHAEEVVAERKLALKDAQNALCEAVAALRQRVRETVPLPLFDQK